MLVNRKRQNSGTWRELGYIWPVPEKLENIPDL